MWLYQRLFLLLLRRWDECGLLDPFVTFTSATNNVRPTHGEAAVMARYQHGLKVEYAGHLKDFIGFFFYLRCFVRFDVSLNARVLFAKADLPLCKYFSETCS
jgi:hypothetical protein